MSEGLTAVRMLELARNDPGQPYSGQHSVFRAAVRQERLQQQRAQIVAAVPVRFEGLPGEYLQVDWGEVPRLPCTRQTPTTRYCLACRLQDSRRSWIRFTPDMRQETLLRGLVDCFVVLGWVPNALRSPADLRQHEGRDVGARCRGPADLDAGAPAPGSRGWLPPGSLYARCGEPEGQRRVAREMGQRQRAARPEFAALTSPTMRTWRSSRARG